MPQNPLIVRASWLSWCMCLFTLPIILHVTLRLRAIRFHIVVINDTVRVMPCQAISPAVQMRLILPALHPESEHDRDACLQHMGTHHTGEADGEIRPTQHSSLETMGLDDTGKSIQKGVHTAKAGYLCSVR